MDARVLEKLTRRTPFKRLPRALRACLFWFTWVGRWCPWPGPDGAFRYGVRHAWELAWMEAGW